MQIQAAAAIEYKSRGGVSHDSVLEMLLIAAMLVSCVLARPYEVYEFIADDVPPPRTYVYVLPRRPAKSTYDIFDPKHHLTGIEG